MDIKWHGLTCVSLKGKSGTIIIDPYNEKETGYKLSKSEPEVVVGNDADSSIDIVQFATKHKFTWPGEYEASGIMIQTISAFDRPRDKEDTKKSDAKKVLLYSILIDEFRVCHLSAIGHKLTPEMLEQIGDVDILFVPVGGTLGAGKAHEVVEQIDPRLVVPMLYDIGVGKVKLAPIDAFVKEVGMQKSEPESVLKLTGRSVLPTDHMEFRLIEPSIG